VDKNKEVDITININGREKDFIEACVRQERWAQKKLYEDHYGHLLGVCLRYAKNQSEASDILHEGFIKVFKHINKYQPGTSLKAWMRRIMVNTSIDYYRKMVRRRTEDIEEAYHIEGHEPQILDKMSSDEILSLVQTLSPSYRVVFNMYIVEGYSHKEIANKLDITESTSRSNLVKARAKMRELIEHHLGKEVRSHG